MSPRSQRRRQAVIPAAALVLLLLLVGLELLIILWLGDGRLTYSLDDAYIHLALGERILQGHYGINLSEPAAPSSSIIWPFLQLPFLMSGAGDWGPLIINTLAAMATLLVYWRVCRLTLCPCRTTLSKAFLLISVLILIPLTNLVGLVFTGMEHSLQLLLASLLVLGLIQESRDGQVSRWLFVVVVLGPLVRYESLALSLPTLLYLALRGHSRQALIAAAGLTVPILAYSLFLNAMGLNPLASSLLAKSTILWHGGKAEAILSNLYANMLTIEGLLLAGLLALSAWIALKPAWPPAERLLAGSVASCLVLHLVFGTMDGYHRYELYAWTAGILALFYLFRDRLRRSLRRRRAYSTGLALLLLVVVGGRQYATPLLTTPLAANDIYRQQYQMHRFAVEFYRQPVAVVDLGRVAYENNSAVLDLWGLGSPSALEYRRSTAGYDWMNELAMENKVRLAMIYAFRFRSLPDNWRPIGTLHLGRQRTTVADDVVTFYALDDDIAEEIVPLLRAFQRSLPQGVSFRIEDGG